jgi:hypothetical protein
MTTYIIEHKTTAADISPGSEYQRRLTLDLQVSMYLACHPHCAGVVYNMIRKSALRPKGGESPLSYGDRIVDAVRDNLGTYFQRSMIVRTEAEIDEHWRDVGYMVNAINTATQVGEFPRYAQSCQQYGSQCPYWSVCAEGGDINGHRYATVPDDHPGTVSTSALKVWQSCPKKYYYQYVLRRRPAAQGSGATDFGHAVHGALEVYMMTGEMRPVTMADRYAEAHANALLQCYIEAWRDDTFKVLACEQKFVRGDICGTLDGVVEL